MIESFQRASLLSLILPNYFDSGTSVDLKYSQLRSSSQKLGEKDLQEKDCYLH